MRARPLSKSSAVGSSEFENGQRAALRNPSISDAVRDGWELLRLSQIVQWAATLWPSGFSWTPTMENLLIILLIGAIAGWLAGVLVRGYGFGLFGNIVVGILGAVVGSWLLAALGIFVGGGIIGAILGATLGAVVLLFLLSFVRRAA